jgi:hypothetical protein
MIQEQFDLTEQAGKFLIAPGNWMPPTRGSLS